MLNTIAIIDMGSNTFHLLIKSYHSKTLAHQDILKKQFSVGLGTNLYNNYLLSTEALERAYAALWNIKTLLNQLQINHIQAFATSAVRVAKNQAEFLNQAQKILKVPVKVLSGEEEGLFIFRGIDKCMDLGSKKSLIVDIGGGSIEYIIAQDHKILWLKSFEEGALKMTQFFHKSDPIDSEHIAEFEHYFENTMQELWTALSEHKPQVFIGAAGSFETIAELIFIHIKKEELQSFATNTSIAIDDFNQMSNWLISKTKEELKELKGMPQLRVNLMIMTTLIVDCLIKKHSFENMVYADYSLKEGVFFDYLAHLP